MRKTIALMLIAAMLLSMSFSAAATQTTEAGTTSVKAGYIAGEEGGQIISVDIEWEGMEFTYNGASAAVWDPKKHEYTGGSEAGWAESNASISITNHSNVILHAGITYSSNSGYEDMSLKFTDEYPYIGSAETSDSTGTECEVIIQAIPWGVLAPDTRTGTEVGQIKVTVAPVESPMYVLASMEDLYGEVPVKFAALPRGELYFETEADKTQVDDYYKAAVAEAGKQDATAAQKNLALNQFLTAFYNKLHLMQPQAETDPKTE